MNPTLTTEKLSHREIAQLLRDVERYLIAVGTFRAEGCETLWHHETLSDPRPLVLATPERRILYHKAAGERPDRPPFRR